MRIRALPLPTQTTDAPASYLLVVDEAPEDTVFPQTQPFAGCAGIIVFPDRVELDTDRAECVIQDWTGDPVTPAPSGDAAHNLAENYGHTQTFTLGKLPESDARHGAAERYAK